MNSRKLLLLDFLGALATSLGTGLLLATEVIATGLPSTILIAMSLIACGFAIFDIVAYRFVRRTVIALAVVAMLNLSYCVAVVILCTMYAQQVTKLGLLYFAIEVPVVLLIVCWDLAIARAELKSR